MELILSSLQQRGLIERHADPADGRRLVASITATGRTTLAARKNKQTKHLAETLASIFDHAELGRLAASVPCSSDSPTTSDRRGHGGPAARGPAVID